MPASFGSASEYCRNFGPNLQLYRDGT